MKSRGQAIRRVPPELWPAVAAGLGHGDFHMTGTIHRQALKPLPESRFVWNDCDKA